MLTQSMKEMFSWRDAFVRWMDTVKEKRKKYGANSPEEIEEQYKRLILMIREHELDKSEDTMSVRESAVHHITLSELVQDAVGIKSFVPSLLSVAGDGLSLVMDASQDAQLRSKMADYVLSDALVSDGQFARRCATLQLVFFQPEDPDERRYLTVSLVARETSPEALFFQTTVVLTPRLATSRILPTVSTTIPRPAPCSWPTISRTRSSSATSFSICGPTPRTSWPTDRLAR